MFVEFWKSVEKFKFTEILTTITGTLHEDLRTFMIISRWILPRMRNLSGKSCRENKITFFFFLRKSYWLWFNVEKIWLSQPDDRWRYKTAHAHSMLDNQGYRHTFRICNTYCNKVTRTRLNVTFVRKLPVLLVRRMVHLHLFIFTYLLTYLLTYSMEQSPSWEANWFCS
jgi:hypothetical protein